MPHTAKYPVDPTQQQGQPTMYSNDSYQQGNPTKYPGFSQSTTSPSSAARQSSYQQQGATQRNQMPYGQSRDPYGGDMDPYTVRETFSTMGMSNQMYQNQQQQVPHTWNYRTGSGPTAANGLAGSRSNSFMGDEYRYPNNQPSPPRRSSPAPPAHRDMPPPNPQEELTKDPRKIRISKKNDVRFYDPVMHTRPEERQKGRVKLMNPGSRFDQQRSRISTSNNNIGRGSRNDGSQNDGRQDLQPYPQYPQERFPLRQDLSPLNQNQGPASNRQKPHQPFAQERSNRKPSVTSRGIESRKQKEDQQSTVKIATSKMYVDNDQSGATVIKGKDFGYFTVPEDVTEMEIILGNENATAIIATVELMQGNGKIKKIAEVDSFTQFRTSTETPSSGSTRTICVANTGPLDNTIFATVRPLTRTSPKTTTTSTASSKPSLAQPPKTAAATASIKNRYTGRPHLSPNIQMGPGSLL